MPDAVNNTNNTPQENNQNMDDSQSMLADRIIQQERLVIDSENRIHGVKMAAQEALFDRKKRDEEDLYKLSKKNTDELTEQRLEGVNLVDGAERTISSVRKQSTKDTISGYSIIKESVFELQGLWADISEATKRHTSTLLDGYKDAVVAVESLKGMIDSLGTTIKVDSSSLDESFKNATIPISGDAIVPPPPPTSPIETPPPPPPADTAVNKFLEIQDLTKKDDPAVPPTGKDDNNKGGQTPPTGSDGPTAPPPKEPPNGSDNPAGPSDTPPPKGPQNGDGYKDALSEYLLRMDLARQFYKNDENLWKLNLSKKTGKEFASSASLRRAGELLEANAIKNKWSLEKKFSEMTAKEKEKFLVQQAELAKTLEENVYKYASKAEKVALLERRRQTARDYQERIRQEMAENELTAANGNARYQENIRLRKQLLAAQQEEIKAEEQKRDLIMSMDITRASDWGKRAQELQRSFDQTLELKTTQLSEIDAQIEQVKKDIERRKKESPKDEKAGAGFQAQLEELLKQKEETEKSMKADKKDNFAKGLKANLMEGVSKGINNGLSQLMDAFAKGVDNAISIVGANKSHIDARLQTMESRTKQSYTEIAKTMKRTIALSPIVKQEDMIAKVKEAVDAGISYNVEQRAFLASVSDKIASTFDAFDSNLMRIIRLQQADTTNARLGMEAYLTRLFNSNYKDTSYLTDSSGYDAISAALVDANAQMSRDMSIAFEFNVHKWMGALSSMGFGHDTLSTIAQGINHLGSGNVQALAGNQQLQSLLAMAASRANLSYSELLVKGIDDSTVNILLESIVKYLQEIATDNNAVVKAAYGDVFSFSQSDLRAAKNLSSDDISSIAKETMDTSKATQETNEQLSAILKRLSTTEMINTVFDNFLYTSGETIANNAALAVTWKLLNLIEGATGGIHLPAISVMGNMIDLSTFTIEGLAKTAIFGLGALSQSVNMVKSLTSGNGTNLDAWKGQEYTSRGFNFTPTVGGVQQGTSSSQSFTSSAGRLLPSNGSPSGDDGGGGAESQGESKSSSSSSDFKKESMNSTSEDQETMSKQSEEKGSEHKNVEDLYKEIFDKQTPIFVIDYLLNERFSSVLTSEGEGNTSKRLAVYDKSTHSLLDSTKTTSGGKTAIRVTPGGTITVSDPYTKTIAAAIESTEQSSYMKVKVINPSDIKTDVASIKIPDKVSLSNEAITYLGQAIANALNGADPTQVGDYETGYTLTDLIKHLIDGKLETNGGYMYWIYSFLEQIKNNTD